MVVLDGSFAITKTGLLLQSRLEEDSHVVVCGGPLVSESDEAFTACFHAMQISSVENKPEKIDEYPVIVLWKPAQAVLHEMSTNSWQAKLTKWRQRWPHRRLILIIEGKLLDKVSEKQQSNFLRRDFLQAMRDFLKSDGKSLSSGPSIQPTPLRSAQVKIDRGMLEQQLLYSQIEIGCHIFLPRSPKETVDCFLDVMKALDFNHQER